MKRPTQMGHGVWVYFDRRRYSGRTYSWLRFAVLPANEQPTCLTPFDTYGDPWPCVTPPRAEVEAAVAEITATHKLETV